MRIRIFGRGLECKKRTGIRLLPESPFLVMYDQFFYLTELVCNVSSES